MFEACACIPGLWLSRGKLKHGVSEVNAAEASRLYHRGDGRSIREERVNNRFSNPKTMAPPRGYTQVVETSGPGRTIYLSGQLGMTPEGAFAGLPGDFRAQAVQCFENLKAGLESAGAGFEHVVKITNFF